jgi:polyphosphate kinase 2 (PPK2 family)
MISYEDIQRMEGALEISAELTRVANEVMKKHGANDPEFWVIVAAGFGCAIDEITDQLNPRFQRMVTAAFRKRNGASGQT